MNRQRKMFLHMLLFALVLAFFFSLDGVAASSSELRPPTGYFKFLFAPWALEALAPPLSDGSYGPLLSFIHKKVWHYYLFVVYPIKMVSFFYGAIIGWFILCLLWDVPPLGGGGNNGGWGP
jgi:hypothetical protein